MEGQGGKDSVSSSRREGRKRRAEDDARESVNASARSEERGEVTVDKNYADSKKLSIICLIKLIYFLNNRNINYTRITI